MPTATMSEAAWARAVAERLNLTGDDDRVRVSEVLKEARIRAGRTRPRHRLRVRSVYFAGIKHLSVNSETSDDVEVPARPRAGSADESKLATVAGASTQSGFARTPFAFAHQFSDGLTAFATDRINDAGKSTILGVILWGLRGEPPVPTLQSDISARWMREAGLVVEIDNASFLITWRIQDGSPRGGIYALTGPLPASVESWRQQALGCGRAEFSADAEPGVEQSVTWPIEAQVGQLERDGLIQTVELFSDAGEFGDVVGDFMLTRLEIGSVRIWGKRRNGVDKYDGGTTEHGWPTLSGALAIIDPTVDTVLGEHVMVTQHLLGVFLGAKWSYAVVAARRAQKGVQAELASLRRRASADKDANAGDLDKLKTEMAAKQVELTTLGDVPDYDVVLAATRRANSDAFDYNKAKNAEFEASAAHSAAQRELAQVRREVHVQTEAVVTKRFFHSLRPSCCPRCDAELDVVQLERERAGHCSLCDKEFEEPTIGLAAEPPSRAREDTNDGNDDGEDDSLTALRDHLDDLQAHLNDLHTQLLSAQQTAATARASLSSSEAELNKLDRAASADRRHLENQIARLEGRIAEREGLNNSRVDEELEPNLFLERVYTAALALATEFRDVDQRQTVADVSQTMTTLGREFGIRNLERARLDGAGHVKVTKGGGDVSNYSAINAGERLRLKVALIIGLLRAGEAAGSGRHPGLLIVDDLTTHEVSPSNAAAMARALADAAGLQLITASTLGPTLADAAGTDSVVMAGANGLMF